MKKLYYKLLICANAAACGWSSGQVSALLLAYALNKWNLADCARTYRGKHTITKAIAHYEQRKLRHQYGQSY